MFQFKDIQELVFRIELTDKTILLLTNVTQ